MPKQIFFPPVDPTWDPDRNVVRFYAVVDGMTVVFNVTGEALHQHFGARSLDAREAIRAFTSHRPQIEEAARRKIEQGLVSGRREVVLGMDDFPTTTTTEAPLPFLRFEPTTSEEVRSSPQLMEVVRAANRVLAEDFARGRDDVTAEWKLVSGSSYPLLQLTLTDKDTQASVLGYFTREDLQSSSTAYFALFRLWDELLRKKAAKLLEKVSEGA